MSWKSLEEVERIEMISSTSFAHPSSKDVRRLRASGGSRGRTAICFPSFVRDLVSSIAPRRYNVASAEPTGGRLEMEKDKNG